MPLNPPPTQLGTDPTKIGAEFSGSVAAVGSSSAAAREDHSHSLGKSLRTPQNFGNSVRFTDATFSPVPPATKWLASTNPLPALSAWCFEFWIANAGNGSNTGESGIFGIFNVPDASGAIGYGWGLDGAAVFNMNGTQPLAVNSVNIRNNTLTHFALEYDGAGTAYMHMNGATQSAAVTPANGRIPAGKSVGIASYSYWSGITIDEMRLSTSMRYGPGAYAVPTAPFKPDAQTLALWHLDDFAVGTAFTHQLVGAETFTQYVNITCDDAQAGNFPLMLQTVQTGGSLNPSTITIAGLTSNVGGLQNGIARGPAVTSLNAGGAPLTGDVTVAPAAGAGGLSVAQLGQAIQIDSTAIPDPTTTLGDTIYKPAVLDLALGVPQANASASSTSGAGWEVWHPYDGNDATQWASQNNPVNQWVQIDLGASQLVGSVRVHGQIPSGAGNGVNYTISGSLDNVTFAVVATRAGLAAANWDETFTLATAGAYRYWRFTCTASAGGGGPVFINTIALFQARTFPARLPIGTAGQVYGVVGGVPAWVTPGAAPVQLGRIVLAAANAQFDFSAIPATYQSLRLILKLRSNKATTFDLLQMFLNANVTANYSGSRVENLGSGAPTGYQEGSGTFADVASVPFATQTGWLRAIFDFPDYADGGFPSWLSRGGLTDPALGANGLYQFEGQGALTVAGAINEINLKLFNGNVAGQTFVIGSSATLYGLP